MPPPSRLLVGQPQLRIDLPVVSDVFEVGNQKGVLRIVVYGVVHNLLFFKVGKDARPNIPVKAFVFFQGGGLDFDNLADATRLSWRVG
ncbi:hypothetical protein Mapa_006503 [Marchantia paleacea]|nr:hypothetical protein Mapa_006503 [Marchantia paleacea]